MSDEFMLSTKDNPYNPFVQWDDWDTWDRQNGYNTTALLGRVVITSDELPQALQDQAYDDAVDEIVSENVSGMHVKVNRPSST